MTLTEAANLTASLVGAGSITHPTPVRRSTERTACNTAPSGAVECGVCHGYRVPAEWCMDSEVGEYAVCADCTTGTPKPRRMVAVTVALSEPLEGPELDWAQTIAAVLRLTYAGTTVEIIDSWRVDA